MVALIHEKPLKEITQKKFITNGEKISRKYRKAAIKKAEYRKLKAIVPSVANQKAVSKLTVIEEAIKYIDQLHSALVRKVLIPDFNNNSSHNINNINLNNSDNGPDSIESDNVVLHNLQRSCDNKSLPFSSANDFIRNFILPQHCQLQQHDEISPTLQFSSQHPSLLHCKHPFLRSNVAETTTGNSLFYNVGVQHIRMMSRQNSTLKAETVLPSSSSTTSSTTPNVSRCALHNVPNFTHNNSSNHSNTLKVKRMLF